MNAMPWSSWQDFAAMGGYGLYVWGSLGVVLAVLVFEQIALTQRRRAALRAIQALAASRRPHSDLPEDMP